VSFICFSDDQDWRKISVLPVQCPVVLTVATLANLSPDSGKAFGYKSYGLAIWRISANFLKAFGSNFFGLAKCTTSIFAHIC